MQSQYVGAEPDLKLRDAKLWPRRGVCLLGISQFHQASWRIVPDDDSERPHSLRAATPIIVACPEQLWFNAPAVIDDDDILGPLPLVAFNWQNRDEPHECEGLDTEGLPAFAALDWYLFGAECLIDPEYVFAGLRKGVEYIDGDSISGYCYTCRVRRRHEEDDDGQPYVIESSYLETYAVFLTDGFQVYDAYFTMCDALGLPIDWEEKFVEKVWDHNDGY